MPIATIERLDAVPSLRLDECYGAPNDVAIHHHARRVDCKSFDSVGLALSGRAEHRCPDASRTRTARAARDRENLDSRAFRHQGYWNNPTTRPAESVPPRLFCSCQSGVSRSIDVSNVIRVFYRQKDMINRAGHKDLFPAEGRVGAFGSIPAVLEARSIATCPVLVNACNPSVVTRGEVGFG